MQAGSPLSSHWCLDRESVIAACFPVQDTLFSCGGVVLAARCAKRIVALFDASSAHLLPAVRQPLFAAVSAVEAVACGLLADPEELKKIHAESKIASRECGRLSRSDSHPSRRASASITYAARAAHAFVAEEDCVADSIKAADGALKAALDADYMAKAIQFDIERVKATGRALRVEKSVIDIIGPLWPYGVPADWPHTVLNTWSTVSTGIPANSDDNALSIKQTDTPERLRRRLAIVKVCLSWPKGAVVSPGAIWKALGGKAYRWNAKTIAYDLNWLSDYLHCGPILAPLGSGLGSRFTDALPHLSIAEKRLEELLVVAEGGS